MSLRQQDANLTLNEMEKINSFISGITGFQV